MLCLISLTSCPLTRPPTNPPQKKSALRAERPDLLTVVLPQSLSKQPTESQELLEQVEDVIENARNDHLSLDVASRLCNSDLLSRADQVSHTCCHGGPKIEVGVRVGIGVGFSSLWSPSTAGATPFRPALHAPRSIAHARLLLNNTTATTPPPQLIGIAFHDSGTVIEATREAAALEKVVTVLYLD